MIGIDMELPKSCKECDLNCTLYRTFNEEEYEIKRHPNCKLVDLGKEDMSWEELKEKCKTFIVKIENKLNNIEYFEIEPCGLSFWKDGTVLDEHNDIILTNQSNFKMYQIIKSLVGDEK